jgi:hypothetical protein
MAFAVKEALTDKEVQSGLQAVIKDGLASQAMVTFTGGAFLVAFALMLGASNLVIGLLAAVPPLMQLLQIPSIYLVEKVRNRRAISVYASALSRTMWLLIALLSVFLSAKAGLAILIGALAIHAALGAVSACSWGSWMRDLVPQGKLGSFFSKRMRLATVYLATNGIINSLAAGIAPILGGKFADFFATRELALTLNWRSPVRELAFNTISFQHWDFFFFLAFLIGLYSIHRLGKIMEIGEVEEKILFHELTSEIRRPLRNLSTVGGLRQMIHFPLSLLRQVPSVTHLRA